METSDRFVKIMGSVAMLMILVIACLWGWQTHKYQKTIRDLQNQVAAQDKTIEVKEGVYKKLAMQTDNLEVLLEGKDKQLSEMQGVIKKNKEKILSVTSASVSWKQAYEASLTGKQSEVAPEKTGDPIRLKVEFEKDFGYIGVNGYTLTSPPLAFVSVKQNRPLKLSLVITQSPNGRWNSYVTSSEENIKVDMDLTAVNPHILEPRWYEKVGLTLSFAGGSVGALAGAGLVVDLGKYSLGPTIWSTVSVRKDTFYGATFSWRPFARNR